MKFYIEPWLSKPRALVARSGPRHWLAGVLGTAVLMGAFVVGLSVPVENIDGPDAKQSTVENAPIKLSEKPPEAEQKPPEPAPVENSIANLAPESFAQDTNIANTGFGAAYGSGGSGPAVGGG
jgi:hypothetical protein